MSDQGMPERLWDLSTRHAAAAALAAELAAERLKLLRVMYADGWSLRRLAALSGITHHRVRQLVKTPPK